MQFLLKMCVVAILRFVGYVLTTYLAINDFCQVNTYFGTNIGRVKILSFSMLANIFGICNF